MRSKGFIVAMALLAAASAQAQSGARTDGMRFVPNVEDQFLALTELAEPLGFNIGHSPNPSACRHYQGMVRVESADGTPYFLVTRSGNLPSSVPLDLCAAGDSPNETGHGHLIVVRMNSRARDGERLRSNRLRRGRMPSFSSPNALDRATNWFTVAGGNPRSANPALRPGLVPQDGVGPLPQYYRHPGGMQVVGKMLALALESPNTPVIDATQIMFFDVSDPENPVFRSQYTPINGAGEIRASAGTVAITPLPSGRYLMMTTGGANTTWYYYRSTLDDLSSPNLSWDYVGSHPAPQAPYDLPDPHQTLQFIRERNIGGDLYLAGARGNYLWAEDRDRIDLYLIRAETDEFMPGETLTLTTRRRGNRISPFPASGGSRLANLAAASTFHVTPSGELLFYATTHDNDGPNASVDMGEWRHINMARPSSPTLLPAFEIDTPFEVEEGGQTSLTGVVGNPVARAWIQLFHEPEFGGIDFTTQSVVVDFDDRDREEYDNLPEYDFRPALPPTPAHHHHDRARSLRWYAPAGCSIRLADAGNANGGVQVFTTLQGNNQVQALTNLGALDRAIDSVRFLPDCEDHYGKDYRIAWDLDRNGSFETETTPATFSAIGLEGPSFVHVPVRIGHPDGSGVELPTFAKVNIRNARPKVKEMRLGGVSPQLPATSPPTVLMGLPVTVEATFTDAGVRDRQVASINWGDGAVDPHTAFAGFSDAFGGATGSLTHSHRFTAAGLRQIVLTVRDDDSGLASSAKGVLVQSPAEWISKVVTDLDTLIAATPDGAQLQHLQQARQALAGSPKRPTDGAIHMIATGNFLAAIDLVNSSIASLHAAGPEAGRFIYPLEQVVASLTALARSGG